MKASFKYSLRKLVVSPILIVAILLPKPARADLWGGDVIVLVKILTQSIKQLVALKNIIGATKGQLELLREVNRGIKDGLNVIRILNPRFNPGLYGNLESADRVLAVINELYGAIPNTGESRLQEAQDLSVAESIAMNGQLFRFADEVDIESKRIIDHARQVNPQGAGKLTAQSMGVLIGVTTQVLRTNSMMLKMMSENMALQNRKEKLSSSQFKAQYEGLTNAFSDLPSTETSKLPELKK